jgi:hypothetical protein
MNKGEKEMAVVTYTVTVTGTSVTISPSIKAVTFVAGDFLIFNRADGTKQDVVVKVVAGLAEGPTIVAAVAGDRRATIDPPSLDSDGNVLITFSDAGGLRGDSPKGGFPP